MEQARNRGFTLVELMVTLAVVAILLSAGAPSFSNLIKNNRMLAENYALRTVLSAARSAAQTQRATVTVCRTADGINCSTGDWGAGYMAFIDLDQDETLDNPDDPDGEQLLQLRLQDTRGVAVSYSQADDILRFDSNGNAVGSSGTFTFCDNRGATEARGIIVSPVGAIRAAAEVIGGEDSAHIVDDHTESDVSCS